LELKEEDDVNNVDSDISDAAEDPVPPNNAPEHEDHHGRREDADMASQRRSDIDQKRRHHHSLPRRSENRSPMNTIALQMLTVPKTRKKKEKGTSTSSRRKVRRKGGSNGCKKAKQKKKKGMKVQELSQQSRPQQHLSPRRQCGGGTEKQTTLQHAMHEYHSCSLRPSETLVKMKKSRPGHLVGTTHIYFCALPI
jgi:hypothetical protein